ncbi:MAG: GNAT family N-acetyltransferase [Caulobacterales bacterium]
MIVRRANSRDAETIVRLAHANARETGTMTALDVDRLRAHAFTQNPLIECYLAEERPGRPAGHAILSKGYDLRRAAATLVVGDLYVAPEFRRGGTARLLISAIAKRAMELGSREIRITTGVDDAIARKFFSAIGAQESQGVLFLMSGDSIEWLATETR